MSVFRLPVPETKTSPVGVLFLLFLFLGPVQVWAGPLATFDRQELRVEEFESIVKIFEAEDILKDPLQKRRFLKSVVETMAIANYAEKLGFHKQPDIEKQISFVSARFLARAFLKKELERRLAQKRFSERDIRLYYKVHSEEFKRPARVRAEILSLRLKPESDREKAEQWLAKIKEALERGDSPLRLENLAEVFWISDTGLKPLSTYKDSLRKPLMEAPLKKWIGPITKGNRIYFLRVIERKKEEQIPLEEVKDEIRTKIEKEAQKELLEQIIAEILAKEKVKIFFENLQ